MYRSGVAALALAGMFAGGPVLAADDVQGLWKTRDGVTAEIAPCEQGSCITLKSGRFAGRKIGYLKPANNRLEGRITDPADNKTYDGHAMVAGDKLKLSGCVMKILCQTQVWTRLPPHG